MEHRPECIQAQEQYTVQVAAYEEQWPNYCRKCKGWGFFYYTYDPSPAGVSLAPGTMTDSDPCPDCVEKGCCPRCGEEVWTDDDWDGEPVTCPKCGWKEDKDLGLDEPPECECWMETEEERAERIAYEMSCTDDVQF